MRHITLPILCSALGAATVNGTTNIMGKLYAILYLPGTIDTAATVTVTSQGIFAKPLLTLAAGGTTDTLYYPRDLVQGASDGADLTGTSGGDRDAPLINGIPRVVIASGGAAGAGTLIIYYE